MVLAVDLAVEVAELETRGLLGSRVEDPPTPTTGTPPISIRRNKTPIEATTPMQNYFSQRHQIKASTVDCGVKRIANFAPPINRELADVREEAAS